METKEIKNFADLKETLKGKVTGYIWMVEDQKPKVYFEKEIVFDELKHSTNPHNKIQEAYLAFNEYCIHIKNIDGEEKIFVNAYSDFENTKDDEKYKRKSLKLPSHISEIKDLKFEQIYELTPSTISVGFDTYQPIVRLFKGITKPEKNN